MASMLETLHRIVKEVNAAPDLEKALGLIVSMVKQAIQCDVCSVYLTDFADHPVTKGLEGIAVLFTVTRSLGVDSDDARVLVRAAIAETPDPRSIEPRHFDVELKRHAFLWVAREVRKMEVDAEALAAFHHLTRTEGILPALESSHALAYVSKLAPTMRPDQSILINLSGRGDKDMHTVAATEGLDI